MESVKCLCNIYLMNKHLVSGSGQLGLVTGISHRLSLHHVLGLPHDLLYYDLRLLFLLTACDPVTRYVFPMPKQVQCMCTIIWLVHVQCQCEYVCLHDALPLILGSVTCMCNTFLVWSC